MTLSQGSRVSHKTKDGTVLASKRTRAQWVQDAVNRDNARRKEERDAINRGLESPPFNPKRGLNLTVEEE